MKHVAIDSIVNCCRHTVVKYISDGKTQAAIISKLCLHHKHVQNLEMKADPLYFVFAEKELEYRIRTVLKKKKAESEQLRSKNGSEVFNAAHLKVSSPKLVLSNAKNRTNESPDIPKRSSDVQRRYVYVASRIAAVMLLPKILKLLEKV